MRTFFFVGIGSLALSAIATACTVSQPAPPDQTVSEFCADYAKAICQVGTSACNFDVDTCATFQTGACMADVAAQQAATTSGAYSQPNGKACVDAVNGAYSMSTIKADTLAMVKAACGKVVVGNQASDKPCASDNDCSGSLVCAPLLGQSGSVCAAVTPKNLGDICGDPGDRCQGDSYCAAQTGAAPQCVATPTVGGACSATIPCGSSNRCVGGTCQARAAVGDTCATDDDCVSGSFCDTYPPAQCANSLSLGRGSYDCKGILGTNEPGGDDGGGGSSSGGGSSDGEAGSPSTEAGE